MKITGGEKLQEALAGIAQKLDRGASVQVGFPERKTYPDKNGTPLAQVAFWNEFGTRNAPPRPFMRPTVDRNWPQWPGIIAANLQATNYDVEATLGRLGLVIKGQMQDMIRSNVPPPNAPATVAKKGFSATLIHTGLMLNSVDFKVVAK